MFISNAYAQAAGAGDAMSSLTNFLPMILMFGVLWFVMIRPQMKKAKEVKAMLEAMAKGDEVLTSGGILAKVVKVGDLYVTLDIANGLEINVQKNAITAILPKGTLKAI